MELSSISVLSSILDLSAIFRGVTDANLSRLSLELSAILSAILGKERAEAICNKSVDLEI